MNGNPDCQRCPLHETTSRVCVMGSGDPSTRIMVIGEAPGRSEEKSGLPFQGDAGRIIRKALDDAGVEAYITNAVHCRPPQNRTPKTAEIFACRKWIQQEIDEISPTHVLLLGNVAIMSVLNMKGVMDLRGKEIEQDGIVYFPTVHPAYVLRNPRMAPVLEADVQRFASLCRGEDDEEDEELRVNYTIVDSPAARRKALKEIESADWVEIDLETSGLNPFDPGSYIASFGVGIEGKQFCFMLEHIESSCHGDAEKQKSIVRRIRTAVGDSRVAAQNGKFDSLFALQVANVDFTIHFDTMLAHYMLDEEAPHSLNFMSSTLLGAEDYDIPLEMKTGRCPGMEIHCKYLAKDLLFTRLLRKMFMKKLDEDPATKKVFHELTMPMCNFYRDVEHVGLYVDPDKLVEALDYWKAREHDFAQKLSQFGSVNYNSPQQVADLLFNRMGLTPLDKTKTGAWSVSESVLKRLREKSEVPEWILGWREANKQSGTFLQSWNAKRDRNSFIHPTFKIHGTVGGRPSCEKPNLQQTPRDPRVRSILCAPAGWEMIEVDISQAEMRIAAEMAKCKPLLRAFRDEEDVHREIVRYSFGIDDPTKEERKKGKAVNFGFLYGMGAKKFREYARDSYGVQVSMAEAVKARKDYFSKWDGLIDWHRRQERFVRTNGYVRSLIGRKRRLPDALLSDPFASSSAVRKSINAPVQSLATDWNQAAAIQMWREFPSSEARVIGTVHDSTLLIVKKGKGRVKRYARRAKEIMEAPSILLENMGLSMKVPMVAEVSIGPWGSGKELT